MKKARSPEKQRKSSKEAAPTSSADTEAAQLKGEELKRPGATLMALLLEAASSRGVTTRALAEHHLGITYSYFSHLRSGERPMEKLGDEAIARIGRFLGLPNVVVKLAAGQLKLEDFYQDPQMPEQYLRPALQFIQRDPDFGAYMPASVFLADPAIGLFIVQLYEKASGRTLIPSRVALSEIVDSYQSLLASSKGS